MEALGVFAALVAYIGRPRRKGGIVRLDPAEGHHHVASWNRSHHAAVLPARENSNYSKGCHKMESEPFEIHECYVIFWKLRTNGRRLEGTFGELCALRNVK